ncbi:MAG: hypothetical protein NVS4B10_06540 [Myxococcales bacterium]
MQPAPTAADPASAFTFATRQVAQILGIGEATVKRLADAGKLPTLREGRARRFSADCVAAFLGADEPQAGAVAASAPPSLRASFAAAARARKLNLALASLIAALARGWGIVRALEELVEPSLSLANGDWFQDLLARVPQLDAEAGRQGSALVWSAAGRTAHAGSVSCLLRGHGFEVLTPAERLAPAGIISLAASARVRFSIVVLPSSDVSLGQVVQLAAELARQYPDGTVVLYCPTQAASFRPPQGVRRAASIGEVASLLGRAGMG